MFVVIEVDVPVTGKLPVDFTIFKPSEAFTDGDATTRV
jgi:hypothetical protein